MTTAAAFLDTYGAVAIAADTCVSRGAQYTSSKLFRVGELWVATAGAGVGCRFLRAAAADPVPPTYDGLCVLSDRLVAWWKGLGGGRVDDGGTWIADVVLLAIGAGQPPWLLDTDGEVVQPDEGYVAIGSGTDHATGALWCGRHLDWSAEDAVRHAVLAAGKHDPFTRGCVVEVLG